MKPETYTVEFVLKEESSSKFSTNDYNLAMNLLDLKTKDLGKKGYVKANMTAIRRGFFKETYYTVYFKRRGDK